MFVSRAEIHNRKINEYDDFKARQNGAASALPKVAATVALLRRLIASAEPGGSVLWRTLHRSSFELHDRNYFWNAINRAGVRTYGNHSPNFRVSREQLEHAVVHARRREAELQRTVSRPLGTRPEAPGPMLSPGYGL
jgi:hypothetical protein